jgi:hypothetical protein
VIIVTVIIPVVVIINHSNYHCPLVMTNIAMENPQNKWRFIAGKSSINGPFSMAMLNNQRVLLLLVLFPVMVIPVVSQ